MMLVSSSIVLASDNFYVKSCIEHVNTIGHTADPTDTASKCRFIVNRYSWECIEIVADGFTQYKTTDKSVYDGIDSNHILACALFESSSASHCLRETLMLRRPTVSDIVACAEK